MSQLEFTGERYVPEVRGQIYYEHIHRYALAARFAEGRDVLDVACGEGYGSAILAESAASVVGIDISEQAVEHAKQVYYVPNLRFVCAPCESLPLADGSIDTVVSFETIEHVADYRQMLQEIRRVLKPMGTLVMSSPNKLVYTDVAQHENPFHVHELYYSEFRDALSAYFSHVKMFGQRIAACSVVSSLERKPRRTAEWLSGNVRDVEAGLPSLPDPNYFIAICSNEDIDDVNLGSAYIDPADDLLRDIWVELAGLRNEQHIRSLSAPVEVPAIAIGPGKGAAIDTTELERELATAREENVRLQSELDRQYAQTSALGAQVAALGAERSALLQSSEHERAEFESQQTSLQAEVSALRSELEIAARERSEFHSMLSSKSWLLTAPLRLGAHAVRRLKKERQ